MNTNRLVFLHSIENDIYLASKDAELYGLKDRYFFYDHYLPSVFLNKYLAKVLLFFYPCIYIGYIFLCFLRTSIVVLFTKKIQLSKGDFFLATGNFSKKINNRINKFSNNSIWILNFDVSSHNYVINNSHIKITHLLSYIDILHAFCDSFLLLFDIYRKFGIYYSLASMRSYNWFLYGNVLKQIPNESTIYFINQKDRWSVLINSLSINNKVLIQHGLERLSSKNGADIELSRGFYCQNPPFKLDRISMVYAFTEGEYEALTHSVISNSPSKCITGFDFKVDEIPHNVPSVLIIGHVRNYGDIEKILIEKLSALNITLYLKNHPTQDVLFYKYLQNKYDFVLINSDIFPDADCIISYESTLALEYESIGKKVIYHTKQDIDAVILSVKSLL